MKKLKELFTHSRFGLGAGIGVTVGYVMNSASLDGIFGGVIAGTLLIIIVENMISRR